jgi:diacylglycerol kinase (ATP)
VGGAVAAGGGGGGGGGGAKTLIFQNYLGIGVDAQAALLFHRTRTHRPHLFISAFTNKLLYCLFGARDLVHHSCAGMHQHVHVIADGVRRELPPDTEGLILLNINSFAGGVRMWESSEGYGASSMQDGMVDVVVVYGALHLGQLKWGVNPVRVCQAKEVKVVVEKRFPMHVDGEPWEQPACTIDIKLRNKALMLRRTADARGHGIAKMADTLEWARKNDVISAEQQKAVMAEAYRRAESERNSMAHATSRSGSLGNLVGLHRRGRSAGSGDEDLYH